MLNEKEIEWIRKNIRNRGIETIDLEYEMLDHISLAMEEKLITGDSFRDAYKTVMAGFGPFGMKKLQEKKYGELRKKGYLLFFKNLITYFHPPKIALTLLIAAILLLLYKYLNNDSIVYYSSGAISFLIPMFYFIKRKIFRMTINFTMMKAMYQISGIIFYVTVYIPMIILMVEPRELSLFAQVLYSLIPLIACIAFLASLKQSIEDVEAEYGSLAVV